MHTSNEKFTAAPQSSAPPTYGQPTATGIPLASAAPHPTGYAPLVPPGAWSSGLCDCFDDVSNCCITFWCPCITFGQIAEIVDKGSTSCGVHGALYGLLAWFTGCACLYSCTYRSKLRSQYQLPENPCGDCCVHFCCETCSLCQEYRELKSRGFNMTIGWEGNTSAQTGGAAMAPQVPHGMSR